MPSRTYQAQVFYQYNAAPDHRGGRLVSFSAPARDIKLWAGVPRKGWTLRALYQRILDKSRISRVGEFFTPRAGARVGNLSPTAVTIALMDSTSQIPEDPGAFALTLEIPEPPDPEGSKIDVEGKLARLAKQLLPSHLGRFSGDLRTVLERYADGSIDRNELDDHLPQEEYVGQFVADLVALATTPYDFLAERNLDKEEADLLLDALYELSKPALIVDGQHRVFGAAEARGPAVTFLVCAIPDCSWQEQAFQFVVINEEAEPVHATVLYDIFGSSLTREEADNVRRRLGPAGKDVERRIAAVIAYRDTESPFLNMVQLQAKDLPLGVKPYLSPRLVVELIDGSRSCRGFRSDPEFIKHVVRPSLQEDASDDLWTAWRDGMWREYWYGLWRAVRDYFNSGEAPLWKPTEQTNLTKSVALKALQDVLLDEMISQARSADEQVERLREIGVDEDKISQFLEELRLPSTADQFAARVKERFLNGFPIGFFERQWVKSLDTAAGMEALRTVLKETWSSYVGRGGTKKYPYWRNAQIYEPAADNKAT
jgi:hypothetical protein